MHTQTRCDFCNGDAPQWVVPSNSFEVLPGHGSAGDWAACDACCTYVRKGNWPGLARYAARHLSRPGHQVEAAVLLQLYGMLSKNLSGKPYRWKNELP